MKFICKLRGVALIRSNVHRYIISALVSYEVTEIECLYF